MSFVCFRKRSTLRRQMAASSHLYSGVTGEKPPDYTSFDPRHQQHTLSQKYKQQQQQRHGGTPEENQYAYTYRKQHAPANHNTIMGIPRHEPEESPVEHVYESPVFSRRELPLPEGPQYFELNPEEVSRQNHITG